MGGRTSTRSARSAGSKTIHNGNDSGINKKRQGGVSMSDLISNDGEESKSVKSLISFYNIEINYIYTCIFFQSINSIDMYLSYKFPKIWIAEKDGNRNTLNCVL